MSFLTKDELKTKAHIEIIDAITRNDDAIVDMIISESITYMKGYLNSRFDVNKIFAQTGDNRDQVVLKILKSLVIYEIYASANQNMMTQTVKDNHDQAIAWLKAVQKTQINPDLPKSLDTTSTPYTTMQFGSNYKRENHY